jgi:hypothetical protein
LEQLDEIARRLSKPSLIGFVRGPSDR